MALEWCLPPLRLDFADIDFLLEFLLKHSFFDTVGKFWVPIRCPVLYKTQGTLWRTRCQSPLSGNFHSNSIGHRNLYLSTTRTLSLTATLVAVTKKRVLFKIQNSSKQKKQTTCKPLDPTLKSNLKRGILATKQPSLSVSNLFLFNRVGGARSLCLTYT